MASALVGGCAGSSDQYPSLAIRDAERVSGQFSPTRSAEAPASPTRQPRANGDIARLVEQAEDSHRAFVAAQSSTSRLVSGARGSGSESEARAQALVALADLSSKRSDTAIALADLDMMAAETAIDLFSSAALDEAQELV
ncbi:MAG: hypothetical protein QNJ15_14305, partial [Erythrobacter sp.]|nr:hypothetical protein [Erythrobacter sp.]